MSDIVFSPESYRKAGGIIEEATQFIKAEIDWIGTCLKEVHGHGVPQAVNGDTLLNQRGTEVSGRHAMLGQQVLHAMDTETLTLCVGK